MAGSDSSTPSSPAAMDCPGDADLRALLQDAAAPERLAVLEGHLEQCGRCRRRLDEMAGAEQVLPAAGSSERPWTSSATLAAIMARLRRMNVGPSISHPAPSPPTLELLTPPIHPGTLGQFAGYDILERIADGGMGIVFKARDLSLDRIVAIKVLAPVLAVRESARARFVREARAAAAVDHEHVVAIHAVGEERGLPFLVMQFVNGRSLETRLQEGPLELGSLLRIALQTAQGLAAAHAQGLVHRDIKPGNILLENGIERVKLTDFGLARAADEPGVTRADVVAGTPEFMSPEQARGERVDRRSDLFSLGAVFYAMAAGYSPFAADSIPATLRRVCEESPPSPSQVNPAIPARLSALIEQLISKAPGDRPESADAVAKELAGMLAAFQSGADPRGKPASQFTPTTGRRIIPLAIAAGVAVVLGFVALIAGWGPWRSRPTPSDAPAPGQLAESPRFVLTRPDGFTQAFTNLAEAIASSTNDVVIELAFSGVYETDSIVIRGRSVVLRAGEGSHPVLVNRSVDRPMLGSDASLILEGLELRAVHADADFARFPSPGQTARRLVASRFRDIREGSMPPRLIQVRDGVLRIANCRLVASTWRDASGDTIVLQGDSRLELLNSEIYNIGGAGVWCRRKGSTREADVRVSNCVFYGVQSFLFSGGGEECRMSIDHSTFIGAHLIAVPRPTRLEVSVSDSLILLRGLLHPLMDDAISSRVRLQELRNVFVEADAGGPRDAAPLRPGPNSLVLNLPLQDRLVALAGSARRLAATDFSLMDEDVAPLTPEQAGIVRDAGAEIALVGPGEGLESFRRTDAYRAWLEGPSGP